MSFNIPISSDTADQLIARLSLSKDDHVFDAGCGEGTFLIRTLAHTKAQGLGVDCVPRLIATAEAAASDRIPNLNWRFVAAKLEDHPIAEETYDVAICLGSTHGFGTGEAAYPNALRELSRVVRPGGRILIGEGYWQQPPAVEYLELIGEPVGIYHDHAGNIEVAESKGLQLMHHVVSSSAEWVAFEEAHLLKAEQALMKNPQDPELQARAERTRIWHEGFRKWGRHTMGFGFYIFQKPTTQPHKTLSD